MADFDFSSIGALPVGTTQPQSASSGFDFSSLGGVPVGQAQNSSTTPDGPGTGAAQQKDYVTATAKVAGGIAENAMAMGSGAIATGIGDVAGAVRSGLNWAQGINQKDPTYDPQALANSIKDTLTYKPQSDAGKILQSGLSSAYQMTGIPELSHYAGQQVGSLTGSPVAADITEDAANAGLSYGVGKGLGVVAPKVSDLANAAGKATVNEFSKPQWFDRNGTEVIKPDLTRTPIKIDPNGSGPDNYNYQDANGVPIFKQDPYFKMPVSRAYTPDYPGWDNTPGAVNGENISRTFSPTKMALAIPTAMGGFGDILQIAGVATDAPKMINATIDAYQKKQAFNAAREAATNTTPTTPTTPPPVVNKSSIFFTEAPRQGFGDEGVSGLPGWSADRSPGPPDERMKNVIGPQMDPKLPIIGAGILGAMYAPNANPFLPEYKQRSKEGYMEPYDMGYNQPLPPRAVRD